MTLEAQRLCLHPKNEYESVAKYGIYFFFAIFCLKFFKIPLDTYIHTYIQWDKYYEKQVSFYGRHRRGAVVGCDVEGGR
jgi:hypothetical protein